MTNFIKGKVCSKCGDTKWLISGDCYRCAWLKIHRSGNRVSPHRKFCGKCMTETDRYFSTGSCIKCACDKSAEFHKNNPEYARDYYRNVVVKKREEEKIKLIERSWKKHPDRAREFLAKHGRELSEKDKEFLNGI